MDRTTYNVTAKHSAPMWQLEVPTTIEVTRRDNTASCWHRKFGCSRDYRCSNTDAVKMFLAEHGYTAIVVSEAR